MTESLIDLSSNERFVKCLLKWFTMIDDNFSEIDYLSEIFEYGKLELVLELFTKEKQFIQVASKYKG